MFIVQDGRKYGALDASAFPFKDQLSTLQKFEKPKIPLSPPPPLV